MAKATYEEVSAGLVTACQELDKQRALVVSLQEKLEGQRLNHLAHLRNILEEVEKLDGRRHALTGNGPTSAPSASVRRLIVTVENGNPNHP